MKISPARRRNAGYISIMLVLSTGTILSLLMIYAYRRAVVSHTIESQMQLRVDYSEKEEAILRSIVAITPNRAIRAMQTDSNLNATNRDPLRWQNIFTESLVLANARTSIPANLVTAMNVPNLRLANTGDSALGTPSRIFNAIPTETGYVSPGINRTLGNGYPPALTCADTTTSDNDKLYPIISTSGPANSPSKYYGSLASGSVGLPVATYPIFNLLKYPQINFGYAKQGDNFVAKRNWWAFSVDVGDHDDDKTLLAKIKRNFVLSIYEIPSQLSISASSFMSLGAYTGTGTGGSGGANWQNVNIDGGMFVSKAKLEGDAAFTSVSSRRGMSFSTNSSGTNIGGQQFTNANNPFAPGVRESYQVTEGAFFPVSLASESGRAAFIPFNRGADFFDRFAHAAEANVLSPTSWNNYTVGALQCAMQLDITAVQSSTNATPTMLRFKYYKSNVLTTTYIPLATSQWLTTLPPGYTQVAVENGSYTIPGTTPMDIAYGVSGGYAFMQGVTGTVTFNNATFGDPKVGTQKFGYTRPRSPFEMKTLTGGQMCVAVYPQRIPSFLTTITADGPTINNSLVVNVDYSSTGLNNSAKKPSIPCTISDYGLVMKECSDLTAFPKGFSLVTNLRMYIGDDFNVVATTPPSGYTPTVTPSNPTGRFLPPCSLFSPERRFGVDVDPFAVTLGGQIGSLASDTVANGVRPLDSKTVGGTALAANRITVNLSQIRHPAEIPPIAMMNWLVLLEERRKEYY